MSIRERWLPILLSCAFVVAMCRVVEVTGYREVLFPEMAAILCGAWIQPRQAWNVSRPLMVGLMGSAATFGVLLNLVIPGAMWCRALLAFLFCAVALQLAGSDMTPMFSAAILPVVLGTDVWVYPVAVAAMVTIVVAAQAAMQRAGWREANGFSPRRRAPREALRGWGLRFAAFAALSAPAYLTGNVYFAIPPLVVAFTAFARPDYTLRLRPWRGWLAIACASAVGTYGRILVETGGVSLSVAAGVTFLGLVWVWDGARAWLPPAGAAALLALLVPYQGPWLYPLEVSIGAVVWIAAAMFLFPGLTPGDDRRRRRAERG